MAKPRSRGQYRVRQISLTALGFKDYREYLASDLWANIRRGIVERHARCQVCRKNRSYTGHHVSYTTAVLAGEDLSQLVAVCRGCHYRVEFRDDVKLTNTVEMHGRLADAASKKSRSNKELKNAKQLRYSTKPKCRCCDKQKGNLGRDQICLSCYKRFRDRVHAVAASNDARLAAVIERT